MLYVRLLILKFNEDKWVFRGSLYLITSSLMILHAY